MVINHKDNFYSAEQNIFGPAVFSVQLFKFSQKKISSKKCCTRNSLLIQREKKRIIRKNFSLSQHLSRTLGLGTENRNSLQLLFSFPLPSYMLFLETKEERGRVNNYHQKIAGINLLNN